MNHLPTLGVLYAWEFEKGARKLDVRVEGQLVFNTPSLIVILGKIERLGTDHRILTGSAIAPQFLLPRFLDAQAPRHLRLLKPKVWQFRERVAELPALAEAKSHLPALS
jgi:hypothetical protein